MILVGEWRLARGVWQELEVVELVQDLVLLRYNEVEGSLRCIDSYIANIMKLLILLIKLVLNLIVRLVSRSICILFISLG